jgi:hypothetical protein
VLFSAVAATSTHPHTHTHAHTRTEPAWEMSTVRGVSVELVGPGTATREYGVAAPRSLSEVLLGDDTHDERSAAVAEEGSDERFQCVRCVFTPPIQV